MFVSSNRRDGLFQVCFSGLVTSHEMLKANTGFIKHSQFTSFKNQLWHFDSIDDLLLSTEEIKQIADQHRSVSLRNPNIKIAICSSSPLVYGFSRMYEGFYADGPWQIMVFYDLDNAKKWLRG